MAARVTIIYAAISAVYILYSDRAVESLFRDPATMTTVSSMKGLGFVLLTSLLLYGLLSRVVGRLLASHRINIEMQERLKNSEERLALALEGGSLGLWDWHIPSGRVVFNARWAEMVGYTLDEIKPDVSSWEAIVHPDDWPLIQAALESHLRGDTASYTSEHRLKHKSGQWVWVLDKGKVLERDAEGRPVRAVGIHMDITRRKQDEAVLLEQAAMYEEMSQMAHIGGWGFDPVTGVGSWTSEVACIHDVEQTEKVTAEFGLSVFREDSRFKIEQAVSEAIASGQSYDLELQMVTPKGNRKWVRTIGRPVFENGRVVKLRGSMQDITQQMLIQQALRDSELKLRLFIDNAPAAIAMFDRDMRYLFVSRRWTEDYLLQDRDVIGKSHYEIFPGMPARWREVHQRGMQGYSEICAEERITIGYQEEWLKWEVHPWYDNAGQIGGIIIMTELITARKQAEAQIHHLAFYDELTGLPNRALLIDRMNQMLATASREGMHSSLIYLDIDHFTTLNDAHSHGHGDRILKELGQRLHHLLREGDTLARLGADEFGILLNARDHDAISASHHAMHVAEKTHQAIRAPFMLDGEEVFVTASMGISLFPEAADRSFDDVLRRSDTALHQAKRHGGNQTVFFEANMGREVEHYFRTDRELRKAIPAGELRLFLQPQVDSQGDVVGAEALVRWQHETRGLVPPGVFVPVAEQTDLIVELDRWVFTEVCKLLTREAISMSPLRISVNISPRHFRQESFLAWVRATITETGADPSRLTLEVTEGLVIDNLNEIVSKMHELSKLGIHFSIDDFGTGYSSLAYLKRMPLHELKIDKTFVQDAPSDPDDAALVETILAVAQHLHLKVVAEGVETEEQADFLRARAQVIMQGYLYGRPQPAEAWLQTLVGDR